MRTERRQELRTNELSQQLRDAADYMKRNATTLTIGLVAAVVIVGGGFAYASSLKNQRAEAWNKLTLSGPDTDAVVRVEQAESVLQDEITPELSLQALLAIGDVSMREALDLKPSTPALDAGAASSDVDWASRAKQAYSQILERFPEKPVPMGQAMIALGVLAENEGDVERARSWYQRVLDEERFALLPFRTHAEYRLTGLEHWSEPVVFPPPLMTVPVPVESEEEAAAGQKPRQPNISPEIKVDTRPVTAARPSAPTTQPAQAPDAGGLPNATE